eukprot:6187409-Pleurochrysis_carterae.AAC.3
MMSPEEIAHAALGTEYQKAPGSGLGAPPRRSQQDWRSEYSMSGETGADDGAAHPVGACGYASQMGFQQAPAALGGVKPSAMSGMLPGSYAPLPPHFVQNASMMGRGTRGGVGLSMQPASPPQPSHGMQPKFGSMQMGGSGSNAQRSHQPQTSCGSQVRAR